MRWHGPAVLALLLAVGVGAGFAASMAAGRQPAASGVPTPVPAQSPSYPVDPAPVYVEDPPSAPLPVDLQLTPARLGAEGFRYELPVPEGWAATPVGPGELKWRNPENPPSWTYVLRVELVGDNQTVARTLEERAEELGEVEQGFEELARTADSLVYSYVHDRHLRVGVIRWVSPSGSPFAEVEVAATGRLVDRPGLEALAVEVSAGAARL